MKNLFKKTILAISIGSGVLALAACNKANSDVNENAARGGQDASGTIAKITRNQFTIKNSFAVKGHEMTGYVLEPKQGGQPAVFYSNDRTGDIIYGMLFDKDGNNLTEQYVNHHIQPLLAKKLFDSVGEANSFLVGSKDAPHQIYLLGEPNCSVCHKLYTALKPYVDNGQLSIQWIMTAFLRPDSIGKAAAILQSKNPAEMLAKDESEDFDMKKEEGAGKVLADNEITDKTKAMLKENMQFMVKNGIRGTPAIFYMDVDGVAKRVDGYPQEEIGAFLKKVGKLPALAAKSKNQKTAG